MLAVIPALLLAVSVAPPSASPAPSPSLIEEALAATEGSGRVRVQPPAGALVGIADANGDGLKDVVIATSRGRGAWLLPGNG